MARLGAGLPRTFPSLHARKDEPLASNFVPTFWFLDPGFLAFCAVVGAIAGIVKLAKFLRR